MKPSALLPVLGLALLLAPRPLGAEEAVPPTLDAERRVAMFEEPVHLTSKAASSATSASTPAAGKSRARGASDQLAVTPVPPRAALGSRRSAAPRTPMIGLLPSRSVSPTA